MHRVTTISRLIFPLLLSLTVHLNVFAQDDEEPVDRDNAVWSDVLPEQEQDVSRDGQEAESSVLEEEDEQDSFTPTEKINVDSAISFPVDI